MSLATIDISIPGLEDLVVGMLEHIGQSGGATPFDVSAAIAAVPGISAGVQTIAMTILSIMAVVEFASAIARYGGDSQMGAKVISFSLFKIALLVTIAKQGTAIAQGVVDEGHALLSSVSTGLSSSGGSLNPATAKGMVAGQSPGALLGAMILLLIPWLLAWVPAIAAKVVLAVVEIQLYLLIAFAALPLAFLANNETRSIAVGYLKKIFALAITPVVVYAMIAMHQQIAGMPDRGGNSIIEWVGNNFVNLIAAPVLLTVLIVSASSMASKVLGD